MDHILTGDEHIIFDAMPTGYLLSDFWAWSSSDLLNNTLRGAFAEFAVSAALGLPLDEPRTDWTPYDLFCPLTPHSKSGIRIEVKSSAYLQAWKNEKLSRIQFSIRPTRAWYSDTGYEEDVRRQSDVYVFCVFACKDRAVADPLCLDGWEFFILPTTVLIAKCKNQQSISLASLLALSPKQVKFDGIKEAILNAYKFPVFTPHSG